MNPYKLYTYRQRPDLVEQANRLNPTVWPVFMLHDPVSDQYWDGLAEHFPDFQFVLCGDAERVIAVGNSIPVAWDGEPGSLPETGWDAALADGFADRDRGRPPTVLSALSAAVDPPLQGQGISYSVVAGMRSLAARAGLPALIAPVRPSLKSSYPLTPIDRYAGWARPDGSPFDPWLRVHWKLGARILRIAHQSMTIPGTVSEWEDWTGMRFPESGEYVVPGALTPVVIDCEADLGRYVEPNVWVRHVVHADPGEGRAYFVSPAS